MTTVEFRCLEVGNVCIHPYDGAWSEVKGDSYWVLLGDYLPVLGYRSFLLVGGRYDHHTVGAVLNVHQSSSFANALFKYDL